MRSLMVEILFVSGVSLLTFGTIADAAAPASADFDICNREAHARAASPSAAGASSASDDVSRGMAAAGQADPAFKHAYIECMKRRGF